MYSTADEPDRALMVRCGNRREAWCPSCAYEYRGDMWQLVYAGLAGGRRGVPESGAGRPQVFATLTAPSFGAVHTIRDGWACRSERRDKGVPEHLIEMAAAALRLSKRAALRPIAADRLPASWPGERPACACACLRRVVVWE
ncbi:MAG: replication initiator [Solirubrobacteraceae bacterium]